MGRVIPALYGVHAITAAYHKCVDPAVPQVADEFLTLLAIGEETVGDVFGGAFPAIPIQCFGWAFLLSNQRSKLL